MDLTITPGKLRGRITPPPSKSQTHRMIIAAALSDGICRLSNVGLSQDIEATLHCMRALGAEISEDGTSIQGVGASLPAAAQRNLEEQAVLDCGESGSTLRFLIPIALALKGKGRFTGRGRLMERPQEPYFELFQQKGIAYTQENSLLTVSGLLLPGRYPIRGDVSSQFITGLLFALPLLEGGSELILTTPLESRDYVDMTLDVLARFGIAVEYNGQELNVPGRQIYRHQDTAIEGDYSQAAFWYAANAMGSEVEIQGLNPSSIQGDRRIVPYVQRLATPGEAALDVSHCPDLVPPLAALAALRVGETTHITGAARLRIKESDRLSSVAGVLNALGADVIEGLDNLTICGRDSLAGGVRVDAYNDHRIAMMAAIAATRCSAPVTIAGAECVAKSYPRFWEDYAALGGRLERREHI